MKILYGRKFLNDNDMLKVDFLYRKKKWSYGSIAREFGVGRNVVTEKYKKWCRLNNIEMW